MKIRCSSITRHGTSSIGNIPDQGDDSYTDEDDDNYVNTPKL